jgi:predicted nucleotidyltransferase
MVDSALTPAELAFLRALNRRGVPFLVVGMSAALLHGVRGSTEDIDLWFPSLDDPQIGEAAREAGGFLIGRVTPPLLGGDIGERFDLVLTMSGLPSFESEYASAVEMAIAGVPIKVLPLERILVSKREANRPKDRIAIGQIEDALRLLHALKERPGE